MVLKEKGALAATTLFPAGQAARVGSQSAVTRQKYLSPASSVSFGIANSHLAPLPVPVQEPGEVNLIEVKFLSSLISTVNALIRSGQIFLGITVLIFSIALPILKLLYLLLLSTLPKRELQRLSRQLRALEWIGKWSMHDVLVLSLSIFFIKSQGVYDAKSLNGVYFFTAAVLFMILAYAWLRGDVGVEDVSAAGVVPLRICGVSLSSLMPWPCTMRSGQKATLRSRPLRRR